MDQKPHREDRVSNEAEDDKIIPIETEDTVFLCQELGISTGVDLNKLIEVARLVEETIGRGLPGKVKTGGNLANYRARAAA